jgi:hypothetical protein
VLNFTREQVSLFRSLSGQFVWTSETIKKFVDAGAIATL